MTSSNRNIVGVQVSPACDGQSAIAPGTTSRDYASNFDPPELGFEVENQKPGTLHSREGLYVPVVLGLKGQQGLILAWQKRLATRPS
jgi:hypothetical protein